MRFFKYLVLIFASIISVNAFAAYKYKAQYGLKATEWMDSGSAACTKLLSLLENNVSSFLSNTETNCYYKSSVNGNTWVASLSRKVECPTAGTPLVAWLEKGSTHIPIQICKDGCTFTGSGTVVEMNNYDNTILQSTGNANDCTNKYKDDPPPKCDKTNPYGDCYVPPDDKCVRAKDGSIFCPDNSKPPENNTCNGADYCKRPPEGCGSGYVSGSFNGQLLCVRSAPNDPKNPPDPDTPDDPNNCMNGGSYCPQPPDNTSCPSGYYETTYNGSKICVRDNLDPTQPNPNDPNNSGGSDNGGGSSDPSDGGGDGTGGSINLKPVIDAINNLKNSLVNSISAISNKITSLIEGQKATNNKLDTSNEHLEKIEEATQATSTAIGETNKKLDQIFSDQGKQQIEQLGEQSTDSRLTNAETEMNSKIQQLANTLSYSSSHACISDFTVTNIPYFGSMTVPLSKWCDLLALVKLLLKLAVLMLALKMIDATVRAF